MVAQTLHACSTVFLSVRRVRYLNINHCRRSMRSSICYIMLYYVHLYPSYDTLFMSTYYCIIRTVYAWVYINMYTHTHTYTHIRFGNETCPWIFTVFSFSAHRNNHTLCIYALVRCVYYNSSIGAYIIVLKLSHRTPISIPHEHNNILHRSLWANLLYAHAHRRRDLCTHRKYRHCWQHSFAHACYIP